ncbi:MAG TPA: type II toxin-antitoxin system VapC family toxin [Thermoleophilaceae bacterium]|nr:type II toxin-antitoxin system VapC family toxin [Thermoleophilaceae bacterium]
MKLLLDTHVLIWWSGGKRVGRAAADAIASPDNEVFVSVAAVWEAEIKAATGKLRLDVDLEAEPAEHGFTSLDISARHAVTAARLPLHHRDPFDRMLVAQAQLEGLTIVSRDPVFDRYSVAVLKS